MKKQLVTVTSTFLMSVLAQAAMANDGKIDFTGGVTASTCEVMVNNGKNDATVNLPVVSSTLLEKAEDTAGRTFLNFSLKNCVIGKDEKILSASIYFVAGSTINTAGRLDNTTKKAEGGTENVDLQILNSDLTPLDLSVGAGAQGAKPIPIDVASGTATIRHYVQYYATGKATAGTLTSSVEYEINYL